MTETPEWPRNLSLSDLTTQAQHFARPTWLLSEQGAGPVAGVWGGEGVVPLPAELVVTDEDELEDGAFFRHWLSVRADLLPLEPVWEGVISIYFNEAQERGVALHDPAASLHDADGEELFASARADLPHADALYMQLDARQQTQLAGAFATTPEILCGQAFGFPHELARTLDTALVGEHPLWSDDPPAAQIGGWPWGWPDAAWDERERQGQTLLLWTFRESEPWLEVWWTGKSFEVVPHIT